MLSRRKFLQTGSLLSLSPVIPCILGSTAKAATSTVDSKVLVVIQLDGGNDGINTVVPFGDDGYGRARTKLRLKPSELHKLTEHVGLHSSMRAAKELFDDGRLSIVQGVGYPNPDRSHFRSMKIWQTAQFDKEQHDGYGWLGRALDQQVALPTTNAPSNAIFVGERETPVALWGRRSTATALSRAEDLRLGANAATGGLSIDSNSNSDSAPVHHALQQFVTKQVLSAYAAADEFAHQELDAAGSSDVDYPDSQLAARLKLISQLLRSGSPTRIFYTVQSGYDTHAAQLYPHARLLRQFSSALKAFLDDLNSAKLEDRVVVLAFSEFGRRVKENASQGTDHGTAGPVFLAGRSVRGGLLGDTPDLTDLTDGDLKMQTDFRGIYATLLDQWLDVASQDVLGATFESLPLLEV